MAAITVRAIWSGVTVRVVDGSTGKVGYRTRVDGGFAALLELQDDVAAAVTGWLRSAPGGAAPVEGRAGLRGHRGLDGLRQ